MKHLRRFALVALIAMNALFVLAQTETFPRWRLVGGTGGVPVEVSSGNALLMSLTGTAAAQDSGLAATLPRYRLAGGTTGNLAEVDSTGHLLVTGIADTLTTGTGKQVLQTAPTLITPELGVATGGGLILTSALNHCLAVGPNGVTTPMLDINCSVASAANGILITPTASGSGVTIATQGGTNEALTLRGKGTGSVSLDATSTNTSAKLAVAGAAKVNAGNTLITNSVSTIFTPPTTQTIAGGDTIAADACGGMKNITAAGGVTTNTTDTFTAPAAANLGCIMHVCNVGAQTITLDHNAHFFTLAGADVALLANTCVLVGQGANTEWRQLSAILTAT